MTTRFRIGVLTMCLVTVLVTASEAGAQAAAPCERDARHRALDFWLGEWQVVDAEGRTVGTNRIEKAQDGCLIEESWTSTGGGTGQSMNYFDPADGMWKQHWVDQGGTVVEYVGGVENGALRYRGRHVRQDGTLTQARVVLEPIGNGRLHALIEHSVDDGTTWTTYFEATYVPAEQPVAAAAVEPIAAPAAEPPSEPVAQQIAPQPAPQPVEPPAESLPEKNPSEQGTAEPAAAATAEPAQPQAARQAVQEGSEVKAVTRELEREEIPEEQAPELVMASPMILQVTPGNVAAYPENAAWSTEETAGFICDEVTLREVEVSYRIKKGKLEVIVDTTVFTRRRIKKVDLLIELFDGDDLVASETIPRIRIGLNIPAHGEEGLVVPAVFELSRDRFEALFDGGGETTFRFTVICPSAS